MKSFKFLFSLFLAVCFTSNAQESIVKNVPFTNIGPTIMSGRVVDFDVNPNEPTEFYVAYASGGPVCTLLEITQWEFKFLPYVVTIIQQQVLSVGRTLPFEFFVIMFSQVRCESFRPVAL